MFKDICLLVTNGCKTKGILQAATNMSIDLKHICKIVIGNFCMKELDEMGSKLFELQTST